MLPPRLARRPVVILPSTGARSPDAFGDWAARTGGRHRVLAKRLGDEAKTAIGLDTAPEILAAEPEASVCSY